MNRPTKFTLDATVLNGAVVFEAQAGDNTMSVQITGAGTTTTLTYETSNDQVNWIAHPGVPNGWAASPTAVSTSTAVGMLIFMVQGQWFRIRVSTAGTGSVTGFYNAGEGWSR